MAFHVDVLCLPRW